MTWGLLAAIGAAVCYGVASVFQALAARKTPSETGVNPRLLIRILGQATFLTGLALDGVGFCLQFLALRSIPVFVVQATLSGSLAVTAVLAAFVFRSPLKSTQWIAVSAVCGGLVLLGLSAGVERAQTPGAGFRIALIAATVGLAGLGWGAMALPPAVRSVTLGLVAGLGFGVVALTARAVTEFAPGRLLRDPAVYALVLAGIVAFTYLTIGFQRGAVTTVTAGMVIGQTVLPSVVGVVVFGDGTRAGYVPVAVAGFALALAGCLALARFGNIEEPTTLGGPA